MTAVLMTPASHAALAQQSAANVQAEEFAQASQDSSMAVGALVAAKGGLLGLAAFSAGVAAGKLGGQLAAAVHAEDYVKQGLQGLGMHAIGQPGPNGHNVSTVGHQIAHSFAIAGFLAAIAIGVAAAALVVATAGVGAVALVGAAAAGGFAGGFLGSAVAGALGKLGAPTGVVLSGSPNVLVNNKPVARVTDWVKCAKEPAPVPIIEGNPTILINGLMLARIGHKIMCGAVLDEGSANVLASEHTEAIAVPQAEVPVWLRVTADWAGFFAAGGDERTHGEPAYTQSIGKNQGGPALRQA